MCGSPSEPGVSVHPLPAQRSALAPEGDAGINTEPGDAGCSGRGLGAAPEGCCRCRGGRSPPGGSYRGVWGGQAWDPRPVPAVSPAARPQVARLLPWFSSVRSPSCRQLRPEVPEPPPRRAPRPALLAGREERAAAAAEGKEGEEEEEEDTGTDAGLGPPSLPASPARPASPPPSDRGQGAEGEVNVAPKLPPKSSSAPPVDITPPPLPIPSSAAPSALDSFRNHSDFAPVSLRIHSRSRCAGIAVGAAAGKAIWGCSGGMSWPFTPSPRPQSWGQHFVFRGLSTTVSLGWVCP